MQNALRDVVVPVYCVTSYGTQRWYLLSPAHLDEFKSTWMSLSSQAQARSGFTWSVHVTVKVVKLSSYLELFESIYFYVLLVRL